MSDKMRWRYGDTNPIQAPVRPETIIEIGDLLWLDEDYAVPFSADRLFDGHSRFLGVAMERSRFGEKFLVRVGTTGSYEFPCEPTECRLGDRVAIEEKQKVRIDRNIVTFIGKSERTFLKPTDKLLVRIRSRIMAL